MCYYMALLKYIHKISVLGRHFHDKITPVNPPTCQNIESNHFKFTTVTVLIPNDGNLGYKIDKSSERFGV